jgi:hypothetical protein
VYLGWRVDMLGWRANGAQSGRKLCWVGALRHFVVVGVLAWPTSALARATRFHVDKGRGRNIAA